MYRKPLYTLGTGAFCQAATVNGNVTVITRENGRIIRRQMSLPGGKIFGARAVSYADAYFEFPFATLEVLGEETVYEVKT